VARIRERLVLKIHGSETETLSSMVSPMHAVLQPVASCLAVLLTWLIKSFGIGLPLPTHGPMRSRDL